LNELVEKGHNFLVTGQADYSHCTHDGSIRTNMNRLRQMRKEDSELSAGQINMIAQGLADRGQLNCLR